ncbi:MAG: hypothetical protein GX234_00615 [Clostridiales bacterium]|nr:hypothetical protein [Clostridiales bacterium]
MENKKSWNHKGYRNTQFLLVVFILIIAAVSGMLSFKVPFIYTVNDDLFMKNILSGAYLGVPDAHTVYMEYPLCMVLAALYKVHAQIPWYGICFFLFHAVSWGAMVYRVAGGRKIRPDWQSIQGFLLGMLLFAACGFYHVASMQFTVTAAVLGAAALVWFMTSDVNQSVKAYLKDQSVTAVFVFLSFNVRRNVLLMLIPIAGMLWLRRAFLCYREKTAGSICKLGGMAVLCAAGVAAAFFSYLAAYGSEGWQDYILYNDHATVLYDYYEWPDYEENRDLYEELGISKEAYVGARDAYLLSVDSGIDSAAMVKLAERSNRLHRESGSFGERAVYALKEIAARTFSDTDRPFNLVVVSLYVLVITGAVFYRRFEALVSLGALFIGRMFSWMYVVYEGRYPMRITQSLLLAETGVLAVILCREVLGRKEKDASEAFGSSMWKKYLPVLLACGYFLILAAFGYVRLKHVYTENTWRISESQDLQDLKDYCEANGEYFYFVDTKSITNDTENIFDRNGNRFEHYIVFGGWLSDSPVFLNKLSLAGVSDVESAILEGRARVIVENEERCPTEYLEHYFASRYEGAVLKEAGRFGRNNDQFIVYTVEMQNHGRD